VVQLELEDRCRQATVEKFEHTDRIHDLEAALAERNNQIDQMKGMLDCQRDELRESDF
jgi:hypothetical protein